MCCLELLSQKVDHQDASNRKARLEHPKTFLKQDHMEKSINLYQKEWRQRREGIACDLKHIISSVELCRGSVTVWAFTASSYEVFRAAQIQPSELTVRRPTMQMNNEAILYSESKVSPYSHV